MYEKDYVERVSDPLYLKKTIEFCGELGFDKTYNPYASLNSSTFRKLYVSTVKNAYSTLKKVVEGEHWDSPGIPGAPNAIVNPLQLYPWMYHNVYLPKRPLFLVSSLFQQPKGAVKLRNGDLRVYANVSTDRSFSRTADVLHMTNSLLSTLNTGGRCVIPTEDIQRVFETVVTIVDNRSRGVIFEVRDGWPQEGRSLYQEVTLHSSQTSEPMRPNTFSVKNPVENVFKGVSPQELSDMKGVSAGVVVGQIKELAWHALKHYAVLHERVVAEWVEPSLASLADVWFDILDHVTKDETGMKFSCPNEIMWVGLDVVDGVLAWRDQSASSSPKVSELFVYRTDLTKSISRWSQRRYPQSIFVEEINNDCWQIKLERGNNA